MVKRNLKQISRDRSLTKEEAERYDSIRAQVEAEKPSIKSRIKSKVSLKDAFEELKDIRVSQGKSLTDLQDMTGMDRSAISKLETGKRENPSLDTLIRYANALGKQILVEISDVDNETT